MPKKPRCHLLGKPRDTFAEDMVDRLSDLADLELRSMFGGHGLYAEGTMFGIVFKHCLYLKVDDDSRADFEARGAGPFEPSRGQILKSYYEVPADVIDDDRELLRWARRALSAAEKSAGAKARKTVSPDEILAPYPPAIRRVAGRLRQLVRRVAPEASELGYPGWKLIGYRSPHYFCFVAPQSDEVRLGFEQGTKLRDPERLLSGTGSQVRFVRVRPGGKLKEAALAGLVEQALALRPKKKTRKKTPRARRKLRHT
jgi:DNA transformation protein and related proteins